MQYYPLELHGWDDFPEKHNEIFGQFMNLLSDKPLFPSRTDVLAVQSDLSSEPRTAFAYRDGLKQDIRPFVRSAIERPVYRVVTAYLGQSGKEDRFFFQDKARSLKNRTLERIDIQPVPDRWGVYESLSGNVRHACMGKYIIPPKIHIEEIMEVLTSPSVGLFMEVLHRKQSGSVNSDIEKKNQEKVAQIPCQTFHYMITSGLLYEHVALREILILLKIEKSAPQNPLIRDVTLLPRGYDEETRESSEEEDVCPGDSNYNLPTKNRAKTRSKPNQQTSQRRQSPHKQNIARRPILPYCTQACLLAPVRALPLHLNCPNATLHQQGQACKKHLITQEVFCSLTKKQLACSLDRDCECLDREGLFGRIGVLFKITLTEYGYTFVAKGVQVVEEPDLARGACVYTHLSHLQGIKPWSFWESLPLSSCIPCQSCAYHTDDVDALGRE
ncbi:hypothetical protein GX51_05418 [Blastomyces parvus]|uniref:Uncharacterized protein n=1 Tax=Blastomyces parvus TaxID=2060905 RepID=A0A2B7WWY3_9EURO|nr:hypothetical protein GX51_05418 [Blastomyces parvus]